MTFDHVTSPDQEFALHSDSTGLHEYPVKYVYIFLIIMYN